MRLFILPIITLISLSSTIAQSFVREDFLWMMGTWIEVNKPNTLEEHWEMLNDSTFSGIGRIKGIHGTSILEEMKIIVADNKAVFSSKVTNQNEGREIGFTLDSIDHQYALHFSNMKHDFPQKIIYRPIADTLMEVRIEGPMKGEWKSVVQTFRRAEFLVGIKNYWLVMLGKGPNRMQRPEEVEKIQQGHLAHITRMVELNKLSIAGPILAESDLRGIFIFNVPTLREVIDLVQMDPAVKSGRLVPEIFPFGSYKGSYLK